MQDGTPGLGKAKMWQKTIERAWGSRWKQKWKWEAYKGWAESQEEQRREGRMLQEGGGLVSEETKEQGTEAVSVKGKAGGFNC